MIRTGALLAAVVAEGLALYTLAELFAAGYNTDRQAPGWWAFVVVALSAFSVPRLTEWFAVSERTATAIKGVSAFVLIYGLIRITYAGDVAIWDFGWFGDFVADSDSARGKGTHAAISAGLLVGLWVRESLRSADDVDLEVMPRIIGPVFGMVTLIALIGALTDRAGEIGRGAAAFYGVAILALAFSQLALSGVSLPDLQAGGITATLLGGTVAVTVAGVVLAGVLFGVLGPVLGPPLGWTIETALTIILTPPAYLLSWFFDLILPDTISFPIDEITEQPGTVEEAPAGEEEGWSARRVGAAGFRTLLILGLMLALAGAVVYFARLRQRARERTEQGPIHATVGSLGEDLGNLWRSLRPRRSQRASAEGEGVVRLYSEVLARAEATGHPRRPSDTPSEFAPVLQETLHRPVTDDITRAFEQARYAGRAPDPATLAALERRWREP